MERTSRRALLRRGLAAVGVGSTAASAGCQSLDRLVDDGSDGPPRPDGPEVSVPPRGDPWYRTWPPIPDVVGVPITTVTHVDHGRLRAVSERLPERTETAIRNVDRRRRDVLGIHPERLDRVVRVAEQGVVLLGDFRAAEVVETVEATGYERTGRQAGHVRYAREDARRALAVADGRAVWAFGDRAQDLVRTTLGAHEGRQPRFADSVPLVSELADRLGSGLYGRIEAFDGPLVLGGGAIEGAVGVRGQGVVVLPDGDALYTVAAIRFVDGLAPNPYAFAAAVRERFAAAEVRMYDTLAVVRGRTPLEAAEIPGRERPGPRWPLVTWGFDRERDGGRATATVTHVAGESVPAADLTLYDGEWTAVETQFADHHETVTPGDRVTLDATGLDRLHLTWGAADRTIRSAEL